MSIKNNSNFLSTKGNEKFEQMYLCILSKYENGITKTKLAELLYLADFRHFYDNLEL